jgi:hypothetical protein
VYITYTRELSLAPPLLHVVLPSALARDADVFEARMYSLLHPGAPSPATTSALNAVSGYLVKRGDERLNMVSPKADLEVIDAVVTIMRRMLQRLVRCGCRDAAGRLARAELARPNLTWDNEQFRSVTPTARWSSLAAMQPVASGETVVLLLSLAESDAAWDAALYKTLTAAEQAGALGVFVHACGVGVDTPAAAAAEQRLEGALLRSADRPAAAAAVAAAEALAAALVVACGVSASDADGAVTLSVALAQLEALAAPTPEAQVVMLLLSAAAALEAGCSDLAAAAAARTTALAALPPRDAGSAAVAAALARLDAACARGAVMGALRAAADEAAAAQAAGASLAQLLDAAPRWEAALAAADGIVSDAAEALSRALDYVRDAAALSVRLTDAASAAPAADALADALATLRAALADAAAASPAVASALTDDLAAGARRAALWEALLALAAAVSAGADQGGIVAAMTAALAAGADGTDLARALAPPASIAVTASAGASQPVGEWQAAGARIRFDPSVVLGTGSRNAVVFAGEFASERAGKAAAPAAVKRLPRPRGGGDDELLALVQREAELLRAINTRSTRIVFFFGYHADADWVYIAYERCERSLAQELDAALPPPMQRLALLEGSALALADLHALGYAHNDVHAGNVLIAADGAVKLTDVQFAVRTRGGAQRFSMSSVAALDVRLNMARRAPEVINAGAKLTTKLDVWALGVLAFQLLTGQPSPFASSRAKQGSGSGGGGGGGGGFLSDAEETRRIRSGDADLSLLDARELRLPRRAAAEARHLLTACLAVRPDARPTATEVCAHPLFWSDARALAGAPLRDLVEARKPEEGALRRAMEAAGLRDAYTRLAAWKADAHAPLLAAHAAARPAARYTDGLAQLLRFARNCVVHPPPAGALPPRLLDTSAGGGAAAAARDADDAEARREAVIAYLLERWPELPLAVHACCAGTAASQKQPGA